MASTPVEVHYNLSGITSPMLEILTPGGSTTPVNGASGDALTLTTQGKHAWEATVTEALAGLYRAVIVSGSTVIADGWVYLADTTTRVYVEDTRAQAMVLNELATIDTNVDAIKTKTDQLVFTVANQVDANALTGGGGDATAAGQSNILSKMLKYNQLITRKDAAIKTDNAVELAEINADGGSGSGAYDNATESQEAIGDKQLSDPAFVLGTTIATVVDAKTFTVTAAIATDDIYNDLRIVLVDADAGTTRSVGLVADYVGSTKQFTLSANPSFTIAVGDEVYVLSQKQFDSATDEVIVGSFNSAALNELATSEIEAVGVLTPGGGIKVIQGDDYIRDQITLTELTSEDWPDLSPAGTVVSLEAIHVDDDQDTPALSTIEITGTIVVATGSTKQIKFNSMTRMVTNIPIGTYNYHVRAKFASGTIETLRYGPRLFEVAQEYEVP